jgi:hypothetical protein
VTSAKGRLATALVKQLRTLEAQINEYCQPIERAFGDHPDHDLFGSLPGGGQKPAPRIRVDCWNPALRGARRQDIRGSMYTGNA